MSVSSVVIGIGNDLRGDDAAGLAAARRLRGALPDGVRLIESGGDLAGLIEAWSGADLAVVIDTVVSGAPAGTVRRHTPLATPAEIPWPSLTARHGSSHALGVADAIALGRALGRLPRELVLYTVEAADLGLGAPLTPAVRRGVARIAVAVAQLLRDQKNHPFG
ncbi:hydrogenase maturation protease [Acrocarpospora catenulata]|uniref:hydrogenase maturation protease n=1 Tax=Acrocarpospora catenulata TaxID=2836182 RepID=UPI0027DF0510|nr:hydrogenase maturation protease [Acrocarpospora catenulata]